MRRAQCVVGCVCVCGAPWWWRALTTSSGRLSSTSHAQRGGRAAASPPPSGRLANRWRGSAGCPCRPCESSPASTAAAGGELTRLRAWGVSSHGSEGRE
eukprot:6799507-Prymnesium_polylepis.1